MKSTHYLGAAVVALLAATFAVDPIDNEFASCVLLGAAALSLAGAFRQYSRGL